MLWVKVAPNHLYFILKTRSLRVTSTIPTPGKQNKKGALPNDVRCSTHRHLNTRFFAAHWPLFTIVVGGLLRAQTAPQAFVCGRSAGGMSKIVHYCGLQARQGLQRCRHSWLGP